MQGDGLHCLKNGHERSGTFILFAFDAFSELLVPSFPVSRTSRWDRLMADFGDDLLRVGRRSDAPRYRSAAVAATRSAGLTRQSLQRPTAGSCSASSTPTASRASCGATAGAVLPDRPGGPRRPALRSDSLHLAMQLAPPARLDPPASFRVSRSLTRRGAASINVVIGRGSYRSDLDRA
jgi:hypothetical protein